MTFYEIRKRKPVGTFVERRATAQETTELTERGGEA